jgi:hypothetical protein
MIMRRLVLLRSPVVASASISHYGCMLGLHRFFYCVHSIPVLLAQYLELFSDIMLDNEFLCENQTNRLAIRVVT